MMDKPKYMLAIPADIAGDIAHFVSNEETRYYLGGFEVKCHNVGFGPKAPSAWFVTAADGHRLGTCRLHDEEVIAFPELGPKDATSWIIKLPANILKACRARPRHMPRHWLRIFERGEGCDVVIGPQTLRHDNGTLDDSILNVERSSDLVIESSNAKVMIDGTFPDWHRVVSQEPLKPVTCAFNANLLQSFGKLSRDKLVAPIKLSTVSTGDAVYIEVAGRSDFLGVLMPMRWHDASPEPRRLIFGEKWNPVDVEAEKAKALKKMGTSKDTTAVGTTAAPQDATAASIEE